MFAAWIESVEYFTVVFLVQNVTVIARFVVLLKCGHRLADMSMFVNKSFTFNFFLLIYFAAAHYLQFL